MSPQERNNNISWYIFYITGVALRITVDVKTDSHEEKVEIIDDNTYIVHVKAARKKGKANIAVIKLLKKHFKQRATIISGHTSTRKIIELED